MAEPGFSRRGRQPQKGVRKGITLAIFPKNMHEVEKNMDAGGGGFVPLALPSEQEYLPSLIVNRKYVLLQIHRKFY